MENQYSQRNQAEEAKYAQREKDWRCGSIVYQVFVDRFAEPPNLASKQGLYPYPKKLRNWAETPKRGGILPEVHVFSHEVDFWGGDLTSLRGKLEYLSHLGIDVLYLNPIHRALTNHKYDAEDYLEIAPEYGAKQDLQDLIEEVHRRGMRLVCDGVFNHMGKNAKIFQEAAANPASPYRDWFCFNEAFSKGVRLWANAPSLPELNWENPAVQDFIYSGENSVVRSYLRLGIDGWRLDTAFELGFEFLAELTASAHQEKPGSLVVGEIWNYPCTWFPALDAVMNFTLRQIILGSVAGTIEPALANDMVAAMIDDSGIDPLLKSWIILDNHDVPRLKSLVPNPQGRQIAQILQFTLPGSPNLYYGAELGMEGGDDPENRAPMRWDLCTAENETYRWTKKLIQIRQQCRALQIGDYRKILSRKLIAFERFTNRIDETILVFVNPTQSEVVEQVLVPDSRLMNGTKLVDLMGDQREFTISSSLITISLPAKSFLVLRPRTGANDGYTPYKRIH